MGLQKTVDSSRHLHLKVMWLGCKSQNKHQKNMCSEEIGLRAPNMVTILEWIVNINWGGLYLTLMTT